jgi:hypothetical protein
VVTVVAVLTAPLYSTTTQLSPLSGPHVIAVAN